MRGRYANSTPRLIKARWPGKCRCGQEIKVGDECLYYPSADVSSRVECRECATPTLEALADERMAQ